MALVPVYQLRDSNGSLYLYVSDLSHFNAGSGITLDSVAFFGCEAGDPGAVPVYVYIIGDETAGNWWLSTDPHAGGGGWVIYNNGNPIFHMLSKGDARAVPIYEWYSESPHTHYYGDSSATFLPPPTTGNFTKNSGGAVFYGVPGLTALNYVITDVSYPQPSVNSLTLTPSILGSQQLENKTPREETQTLNITTSVAQSYTLTLSDTLSIAGTVGVTLGLPGAKVNASVTTTMSMTESTASTHTMTNSVSVGGAITVPAHKTYSYTLTEYQSQSQSVPWTVTASASLNHFAPNDLIAILQGQNPAFNGTLTAVPDTQTIEVVLNGSIEGTWCIDLKGEMTDVSSNQKLTDASLPPVKVTA